MRVTSAIICEKVAKLVTGRAVAYGIFPGWVNVAPGHQGMSMPVSALLHVSLSHAGPADLTLRVHLPDGAVHELSPLRVESDGLHPSEVYLNDVHVPLARPGPLIVEVRHAQGLWKEAARLVLVHVGEAAPATGPSGDGGTLTPEVSGLPN